MLHYKLKDIAPLLTAKTFKNALAWRYAHTRIGIVVKWAKTFVVCSSTFQRNILSYHFLYGSYVKDFVYDGLWYHYIVQINDNIRVGTRLQGLFLHYIQ